MSESNLHSLHVKNAVIVHHDSEQIVNVTTKWTLREKSLCIIILILLATLAVLVAVFVICGPFIFIPFVTNREQNAVELGFSGVCDSAECVEISHRVINSGSFQEDPCRDFYNYACSNWQKENAIPPEQLYHAANINLLRDRVDTRIKNILEEPTENSDEDEIEPVIAFYQSCLNFSNTNEESIVLELVKSLGGYQLSESWSDSQFDLTNLTMNFLRVNAAPLFDLTLDIDAKNNSRYALIVELPRATSLVPNLFQPRHPDDGILSGVSFRTNSEPEGSRIPPDSPAFLERHRLYQMITDMYEAKKVEQLKDLIQSIGRAASMREEDLASDVKEIAMIVNRIQTSGSRVLLNDIFTEMSLKLVPSQRTRKFWKQQNRVYNEFTIDALQTQFDGIKWKTLIRGLTGTDGRRQSLDWNNAKIYVPYPDYLRKLFQVLQFTNKRLIQNMMLMSYVRDMVNDLTEKKKFENRWKFCVQSAKSVFAMELSSKYLRSFPNHYLLQVRNDIDEIFLRVKDSLISFLNASEWLENKTKVEAIRKIHYLKGHFLAPSFYLKDDFLEDAVRKINIDPTDFFTNVRLVYRLFREQLYKLYWKQVDEEKATWAFVAFPFTVNAFYIQQFNSIVIPLAFLNPPQYTLNAPEYINFATIGLTIAHEALHSLDGSGSGFDADGKLNEWWSEESRNMLRDKSICVATQYSEHFQKLISFFETRVPIQVDGNLTQNENIADIAGLQVAHLAYKTRRGSQNQQNSIAELKIPGVNHTLEQLFFLTVAQAYCANISPMGYIFLLELDEHTPHPERINGMLMNIPEFAHAYKCPYGSPMNPTAKCILW